MQKRRWDDQKEGKKKSTLGIISSVVVVMAVDSITGQPASGHFSATSSSHSTLVLIGAVGKKKLLHTIPLALFHSKHEEFIGAFVHSGQQKKYRRLMWTGHKANTAQAAAA